MDHQYPYNFAERLQKEIENAMMESDLSFIIGLDCDPSELDFREAYECLSSDSHDFFSYLRKEVKNNAPINLVVRRKGNRFGYWEGELFINFFPTNNEISYRFVKDRFYPATDSLKCEAWNFLLRCLSP